MLCFYVFALQARRRPGWRMLKGGILMLTQKELLHLEDFLGAEQNCVKTLNHLSSTIQDNQCKQLFQQFAQKNQQHFQTVSQHLNAGQKLQ